ncbi:MAG: transglutaminase-like domain-containing protein, partial [Spirochaetia bacterium]|nr:transglutaminase-like domain-containing protein [Spirochaetia bacterium]
KAYLNYFFNELNFHGSQDTAGNIDHHNIQKVVNSKEGSAIILCILANRIAAGAGINLPIVITAGHFLLRTNIENEIPFIDPFENGKIISEKEHMYNVASKGYDPSIGLLHITSPLILLQRLLRNIAQSMNRLPNQNVNPQIKELQEIIKSFIKDNP